MSTSHVYRSSSRDGFATWTSGGPEWYRYGSPPTPMNTLRLRNVTPPTALRLRTGEWVEVRSREEILSTLDGRGRLEDMPFMPEMFQYCGSRFRVFKRAHKTCDTVNRTGGRRVRSAVHLDGVRCDGGGHGGCQAACLIFWKEAWLKRVGAPKRRLSLLPDARPTAAPRGTRCTE